jgi:TPR repeat protein
MSRNTIRTDKNLDWSKLDPDGERLWALGSQLEDEGKLELAVEAYLTGAKLGDPLAQVNLANILDDKLNKPAEAIYWYKRAVRFGYSTAALNLAAHYKNLGVRRWHIYWLKIAANMGDKWAVDELEAQNLDFTRKKSAD